MKSATYAGQQRAPQNYIQMELQEVISKLKASHNTSLEQKQQVTKELQSSPSVEHIYCFKTYPAFNCMIGAYKLLLKMKHTLHESLTCIFIFIFFIPFFAMCVCWKVFLTF